MMIQNNDRTMIERWQNNDCDDEYSNTMTLWQYGNSLIYVNQILLIPLQTMFTLCPDMSNLTKEALHPKK